jgi:hypothetical protein
VRIGDPVLRLAEPAHVVHLGPGPAQRRQRRQAADQLEHVARDRLQHLVVPAVPLAGGPADQRQEHRDQRHRHQHGGRGDRVDREDHRQHGQRHQRRQHHLRQVPGEVRVEPVEAAGGQVGHRPRVLAVEVPAAGHRAEHAVAQFGLHRGGGPVGGHLLAPRHDRPRDHDQRQPDQQPAGQAGAAGDGRDAGGQQPGLPDDQRRRGQAQQHGDDQEPSRRPGMPPQPPIERPHARIVRFLPCPTCLQGVLSGAFLTERTPCRHGSVPVRPPA